jgi:hypothetical protein
MEGIAEMHSKSKKAIATLATAVLSLTGLTSMVLATPASAVAPTTVQDFENSPNSGFGGDSSAVVENSGAHTLVTTRGYECWAGTTIETLSNAEFISTATGMTITAPINAAVSGVVVKLKLEDSTSLNAIKVESDFTTTQTGWQLATWDFTSAPGFNDANTYDKASIFYDFNCGGGSYATGSTWALDNFTYPLHDLSGVPCAPSANKIIRVTTPSLVAGTNAFNINSWISGWNPGGSRGFVNYVKAGSVYNLTYQVTDSCGQNVNGATVDLHVNGNYSGSNATFTSGATVINAEYGNGGQGGGPAETVLTGTSDSSGYVTFNLTNTNNPGAAEQIPASLSEDPTGHTNPIFSTIFPRISGTSSKVDVLITHFVIDPNWHPPVCVPTKTKQVRFLNPDMVPGTNAYNATDWIAAVSNPGTRAFLQYLHAGSDMTLTYIVTDNCGTPFADVPVSLKVNANWSCSNATFTAGGLAISPDFCNGKGETVLPAQKTNASGFVTFHLTNTNSAVTAEPTPGSLVSPPSDSVVASKQQVSTNIQPYIDGTESTDWYFAHFTRDAKLDVTAPGAVDSGSRSKVVIHVTGSNALPLANAQVSLKVSGVGTFAGTGLLKDNLGTLVAVTNSSGDAILNFASAVTDSGSGTIQATYSDSSGFTTSKTVSFTVTPASERVATTNAVAGTGYATFTVNNAGGKLVSVVLNGSKRVYRFFPRKATESYTIKAPAGVNTLTVYIGGKATTYKVTVK